MSLILSMPYGERRVVVVAPAKEQQVGESSVNWAALGVGLGTLGPLLLPSFLLPYLAYKGIKRALGGDVASHEKLDGVLPVSLSEAGAELQFPPGHPLLDHAYVGHPLVASQYVPIAAFHRWLFEEKVNELVTLLASLGATWVRVTLQQGYRSAAGVSLGVSVPGKSASVEGERTETHGKHASFEERYKPHGEPRIPGDLVWYGHEKSWQALARRRIEHGVTSFKAELRYEDDFGINARLKGKLAGIGVNIGGSFSEFETTVWEFEGTFG